MPFTLLQVSLEVVVHVTDDWGRIHRDVFHHCCYINTLVPHLGTLGPNDEDENSLVVFGSLDDNTINGLAYVAKC